LAVEIGGQLEVAWLREDHLKCLFMVVAAERALFADVADPEHEIDKVMDRVDFVVQCRVLAVDGLDKTPVLVDDLHVVGVDPEVRCVHKIDEEDFIEHLAFTQLEPEIGQQVDRLAVDNWHLLGLGGKL